MERTLDPPLEISTARLRLRKPALTDSAALFRAYCSDPEVVRFLTWKAHETEQETEDFLRRCEQTWLDGTRFGYIVEPAGGGADPVGMIDLHDKVLAVGFGYVLARSHWGKGYMSEALAALVDWSLAQPRVWRAYAFCDVENRGSARVMEKAGMSFEGILRRYSVSPNLSPEPRDCRMYAKVRH